MNKTTPVVTNGKDLITEEIMERINGFKYVHHAIDKAAFFQVLYSGIKIAVLKKVDNLSNHSGHKIICKLSEVKFNYIG
jgi:hypothetical protein